MVVDVVTSDRKALAMVFKVIVRIKVISWVKMAITIIWMVAGLNLLDLLNQSVTLFDVILVLLVDESQVFSLVDATLHAFQVPLADVFLLVIVSLDQIVAIAVIALMASDKAAVAVIILVASDKAAIAVIILVASDMVTAAVIDLVASDTAAFAVIVVGAFDMVAIAVIVLVAFGMAIVAVIDLGASDMVAVAIITGFVASFVSIKVIKFVQRIAVFPKDIHKSITIVVIASFTAIFAVLEGIRGTVTDIKAIVTAIAIIVKFMDTATTTTMVAEFNLSVAMVITFVATAKATFIKMQTINIEEEDFEATSCRLRMVKTGFFPNHLSLKFRMQTLALQSARGIQMDGHRGHGHNGGLAQDGSHDAVRSHMVPHGGI